MLLNGLDAIVFTGGVAENDDRMRKLCCSNLDYLKIHLVEEKNEPRSNDLFEFHTEKASVKILVIPTDEELEIADQMLGLA